jgi:uncharacterized protein (DUF302 family)
MVPLAHAVRSIMLEIRSMYRWHAAEVGLRAATNRHGGHVLAVSDVDQLLLSTDAPEDVRAVTLTVGFPELHTALLAADIRFAAFLPIRVAVCDRPDGVFFEAMSPRECCRMLHRHDLEPVAVELEDRLRAVMEEAAGGHASAASEPHPVTEEQVNMRAALPQRIDSVGTKIEELAGTGTHDAQGG